MTTAAATLAFERFPFFIGLRDPEKDDPGIPAYLPLALRVDPHLAVPRLVLTPEIEVALQRAYGAGSMLSTPLGASPLAAVRLDETLAGVLAANGDTVRDKRILEVGCGRGDLLAALQQKGARVTGCEIGPQGEEAARRFGIHVTREPLRPGLFDQKFDGIISYGCLEHIADLPEFLATCRAYLKPDGLFFHSVPNTDSAYATARTDDLCHEHINYFTPENSTRLFAAQGFVDGAATLTKAGNEIHVWGFYSENATPRWPGSDLNVFAAEERRLGDFARRATAALSRRVAAVDAMLASGQCVGFYAGGHTVGSMLRDPASIRYYDGDSWKHGKTWLQGLSPIRSPETLSRDPVDSLIVGPDHYFDAIRAYLVETVRLPDSTRVIRLSEL